MKKAKNNEPYPFRQEQVNKIFDCKKVCKNFKLLKELIKDENDCAYMIETILHMAKEIWDDDENSLTIDFDCSDWECDLADKLYKYYKNAKTDTQ